MDTAAQAALREERTLHTNGMVVGHHRVVHEKTAREHRNRAGGVPADPDALDAVYQKLTQGDPRRITSIMLNGETGRFRMSALPKNTTLSEKWSRLPCEAGPMDYAIGYAGVLSVREEQLTVVRVERQLVVPKLFAIERIEQGSPVPPLNIFLRAASRWLREYADILPIVAKKNDSQQYQWFIGREWFVPASLIGGRGIQQIRVLKGKGIVATNGTNSLFFLSKEQIFTAARANEPLPADRVAWTEIHRGTSGAIGFLTPAYEQGEVTYISLHNQNGTHVPLPMTHVA